MNSKELAIRRSIVDKRWRIFSLTAGSIGFGIVLFGLGASLGDGGQSLWKFLAVGTSVIAMAVLSYRFFAASRGETRERRRR